jgi:hypothetical protein
MRTVDWHNKKILAGDRPGYGGTYFMWHVQEYWDDCFSKKGAMN